MCCISPITACKYNFYSSTKQLELTAINLSPAPSSPWQLEVKESDAFTITVQWRRPQILNGALRGYTVSLHNKDGSLPNRNVSSVTTDPVVFKINALEPFTSYWIKVLKFLCWKANLKFCKLYLEVYAKVSVLTLEMIFYYIYRFLPIVIYKMNAKAF